MENYSIILKSFRLALICGATFAPLSQVNAGWSDRVDALTDVTPDQVGPLKQRCVDKLKVSPNSDKWKRRNRQLESSNLIKNVDELKRHLRDPILQSYRTDQVRGSDTQKVVAKVIEQGGGADTQLRRTVFENAIEKQRLEVERKKTPASTLVKHDVINVADQIQSIEEALPMLEGTPDKRGYVSLLAKLKRAQEMGITEYSNDEELTSPVGKKPAVAAKSSDSPKPPAAVRRKSVAKTSAISTFQAPKVSPVSPKTNGETTVPSKSSAVAKKTEVSKKTKVETRIEELEELKALLPSWEKKSVDEQIALFKKAQNLGITDYESEELLREIFDGPAPVAVQEEVPANTNARIDEVTVQEEEPAPVVWNVAEWIAKAKHDYEVTFAGDAEKQSQAVQLRKLMEFAQSLGMENVTSSDFARLQQQMDELEANAQPTHGEIGEQAVQGETPISVAGTINFVTRDINETFVDEPEMQAEARSLLALLELAQGLGIETFNSPEDLSAQIAAKLK